MNSNLFHIWLCLTVWIIDNISLVLVLQCYFWHSHWEKLEFEHSYSRKVGTKQDSKAALFILGLRKKEYLESKNFLWYRKVAKLVNFQSQKQSLEETFALLSRPKQFRKYYCTDANFVQIKNIKLLNERLRWKQFSVQLNGLVRFFAFELPLLQIFWRIKLGIANFRLISHFRKKIFN